jgi:mannosyltransferase OCH1-like enzyme
MTIPKIMHRVLIGNETKLSQSCWESVKKNTQGWLHQTHSSEDPLDYPMTGHLLNQCKDPALKSDLIRLEVLYKFGGIYVDTDIELFRPLDSLLNLQAFAAWESKKYLCNAVMGSPKGHPAILDAIELTKKTFEDKTAATIINGVVVRGPLVITKSWKKRKDVDLLEQKTFYPYSYDENPIPRDELVQDPDIFGVHYWNKSWS